MCAEDRDTLLSSVRSENDAFCSLDRGTKGSSKLDDRYYMARDSQDVAAEVLDLVYRFSHDPVRCTYLLATKLEAIYDCAFALGYRQGKQFAMEYAYDSVFADRETLMLRRDILRYRSQSVPADIPKRRAANTEVTKGESTKHKVLYRLPCAVCGAFYTEEECPLCNPKLKSNTLPSEAATTKAAFEQ
jgi:hypothetical protein